MRYVQYPNAFSRGKATSRVPSINGTRYNPKPIITGTANRNIIVEPCMLKISLYRFGPSTVFCGRDS